MTDTILIPMYKMARKPVPQHVDAVPQAILIEDIKLPIIDYENPSPPIAPQYRSLPTPHSHNSSDTFYHPRKMSNGQVKTGTSELADFLKSSKPEDFGSPAVTGSTDDLSLSGSSHHKKRRFLRSSTPRDGSGKSQTHTPPPFRPPHVTPKLTSKGSHYLQIQVDYGNMGSEPGQSLKKTTDNSVSHPISDPANNSSGKTTTKGGIAASTQSRQPHMGVSPPPWSPPLSRPSAVDGAFEYQNFVRMYTQQTHTQQRRTPVLPALKTDFGTPQGKIPQIERHIPRTLHTTTREIEIQNRTSLGSVDAGSFYNSLGPQESPKGSSDGHARTSPEGLSSHSSRRSEANTPTGENTAPQFEHIQLRKIPKPGPPPSRALPSLPEIHDISTLSGRSGFPILTFPDKKGDLHATDRKRREDWVKARKTKDLKQMQQRKLEEAIRLLDSDPESKERACHVPPTVSPVSPISTTGLETKRGSSQTPSVNDANATINTILTRNTPEPHPSNRFQLLTHDAPTPPRSPSPLLHPTMSVRSVSKSSQAQRHTLSAENLRGLLEQSLARQTELEDRLESMEHKYMILEQALITVLQRTSPHRSESNSIENLLADFRITHPCRGWSEAFPLERDLSQIEH